jgi:dTDP-4-dehydrorhamnose 3,5-epimerase-like enzyme
MSKSSRLNLGDDSKLAMHSLSDLRFIQLSRFVEPNGELVIAEVEKHVPFPVKRAFVVRADSNVMRGQHAHRRCSQVLVCLHGAVRLSCDDGVEQREVELNQPHQAVLIPPSLWAEQLYLETPTILLVLCDRLFEEADYIRDRKEFEQYRVAIARSKDVETA